MTPTDEIAACIAILTLAPWIVGVPLALAWVLADVAIFRLTGRHVLPADVLHGPGGSQ